MAASFFIAQFHKPQTIGITLDEHGWANVDELIKEIVINILDRGFKSS